MIDMEWLRRLVELVDESNIDSLEISRFATRVRISKSPPAGSVGGTAPAPAVPAVSSAPTREAAPDAEGGGEEAGAAAEPEDAGLHEIESPMVGTFYRAPAPDAPPYVEVGERVEKGQTLCILEAMKLMNELESEVEGVIREIAVENADPVEYGQVLFRIQTDGAG